MTRGINVSKVGQILGTLRSRDNFDQTTTCPFHIFTTCQGCCEGSTVELEIFIFSQNKLQPSTLVDIFCYLRPKAEMSIEDNGYVVAHYSKDVPKSS